MRQEKLDCRGLACPGPVLKTKEVVELGEVERLTVLVDSSASRENVSRLLGRYGYQVEVAEQNGTFEITARRPEGTSCETVVPERPLASEKRKVMVLLGNDRLGRGDAELGRKLIINFLATLKEMGDEVWRLVLVNAAVKLAIEGSEVLDSLRELENDGVVVLVCGTCLNHYELLEQKRVGETTNMLDIVTAMQLADKVISLT